MRIGGLILKQMTPAAIEKRHLAGRVTVNSVGVSRRVVVQKRGTFEYVSSTHSNADGSWDMRGIPVLPEKSLLAIAVDDTGQYNAEILDFLSQVE